MVYPVRPPGWDPEWAGRPKQTGLCRKRPRKRPVAPSEETTAFPVKRNLIAYSRIVKSRGRDAAM